MVPADILQRVFYIRHAAASGTAFALEANRMQFLVTAKHVVDVLQPPWPLEVFQNGGWRALPVNQVWQSTSGADVAVICLALALPEAPPVTIAPAHFYLSERIYFLGFPFGLTMDVGATNDGYPIPLVKTGIVASFSRGVAGGSQLIMLDGHNNPGFSGGPVVTVAANHHVSVIGVVSGYRHQRDPILLNGQPTGLTHQTNTGLVVSYGMSEVAHYIATSTDGARLP